MADNIRTQRKAAIKRASAEARRSMNSLDARAAGELTAVYEKARRDIEDQIRSYAGQTGTLRLEILQDLLAQVKARLNQLSSERDRLLDANMQDAARSGVQPFAVDSAVLGASLTQIADEALRYVRSFVAEDGLQLSDRLWRLDNGAREAVTQAIESAVIQGHSASQAAQDFLARGAPVPADIQSKEAIAAGDRVATASGRALMTNDGNSYSNALRVFRTEINRAHGQAYLTAAQDHPDVIGTRFLLSPNHPRVDICDMYASVNRYGLGPGVYPPGKNPWPAHPNTLSYVEVVFADEVTHEDRSNTQTPLEWIRQQSAGEQISILGSTRKHQALQRGILKENQIATPWEVLKKRYERQGISID